MTYVAADEPLRLDALPPQRPQRSDAARRSRSASGTTSATTSRSRPSGRSCAGRSTSASRTSISRTTTARPTASAEINFGRHMRDDFAPVPRRADHLQQGGLRHVARPVRRLRLAQVPAREPRPEPAADGARLRRHLLLAPLRPGHAARGDDRRARHRGPPGQGAVRRHLAPTRARAPRRRCAILRRAGHAAAHPPAVLLAAQPLDRGGPARRARARRASAASCSRRSPRACSPTVTWTASPRTRARRPAASLSEDMLTEDSLDARARPQRDRAASAGRRSRRWRSPGRCATRASPPR